MTRKGAALPAAAALATVAAGSVAAAPSRDALVRPGLSIGKVRLGMDAVELLGPRGRERVVSIATSRKSERTGAGIGPGVRVARLMRVYPRARCRSLSPVGGGSIIGSEFVVDAGGGRETAFVRGKWGGSTARPVRPELDARNVVEVIVRARAARPPADEGRC